MFSSKFISEPFRGLKIKKARSITEASGGVPLRRSSRLSQLCGKTMTESDSESSASEYSNGYSCDSDKEAAQVSGILQLVLYSLKFCGCACYHLFCNACINCMKQCR